MVTVVEDEYANIIELDAEIKKEYEKKKVQLEASKDAIFQLIDFPPAEVIAVNEFFKNESLVLDLKTSGELNIDILTSKYNISLEALEAYFKYAKFQYECGMYEESQRSLMNYLSISQSHNPTVLLALWGRLACNIVQGLWEPSKDDLKNLKEAIDIRNVSPMEQLRQRGWILHWSLFVHFTQREGFDLFLEFVSDRAYMQAIQNICPWLLRYYAIAVLLSPRRKVLLRDLLNEIQNIGYLYTDPILGFVESLYDNFDIDLTQQKLKETLIVMKNDFFLCSHAQKFADVAKMLICEMFCTMYSTINLQELATKLELSEDEAEKWMVSMVKTTSGSGISNTVDNDKSNQVSVDARIDSSAKQVILAPPSVNIFQQVVDKTKDLTLRSSMLFTNMNTMLQEQGILINNIQN